MNKTETINPHRWPLSADQKTSIRKIMIQMAQFIEGGAGAVEPDSESPLWRFDNNQKIIIERAIDRVVAVAENNRKDQQ